MFTASVWISDFKLLVLLMFPIYSLSNTFCDSLKSLYFLLNFSTNNFWDNKRISFDSFESAVFSFNVIVFGFSVMFSIIVILDFVNSIGLSKSLYSKILYMDASSL